LYNNSSALHTFEAPIGIDGATVAIEANAGSLTFNDIIYVNANTVAFSASSAIIVGGQMQGVGGSLTKTGTASLTLNAANTYTGSTSVNQGRLVVNGSLSSGTVSVATGATLSGTGTVGPATFSLASTLEPGNSAGTLTTGNLTLANSTALAFELDVPNTVGGTNDLVQVNGNLTLDGLLNVTQGTSFGYGIYRLFNYTGTLTNNSVVLDAGLLTAYPGSTVDTSTSGQVNLVVVPEPSVAGAVLLGSGVLLAFRRRRI
jgi:fibronectin-binding autotransporter adhesin